MFKRLLLLSFVLILSGCITFDSTTAINSQTKQQWQFTGKFAVKTPNDKNSAKLYWSQVDDQYDINIYTVFGISVMSIIGDDNQVTIEQNGEVYTGANAQQLIYRLTRWHLPVNDLQQWVQGSVYNSTDSKYDSDGNFSQGTITSNDNKQWQLTLSNYKIINNVPRPHKLLLKSGDSYFKLAMNQWKIQK